MLYQVTTPYKQTVAWFENLPRVIRNVNLTRFFRRLLQLFQLVATGRSPGIDHLSQALIQSEVREGSVGIDLFQIGDHVLKSVTPRLPAKRAAVTGSIPTGIVKTGKGCHPARIYERPRLWQNLGEPLGRSGNIANTLTQLQVMDSDFQRSRLCRVDLLRSLSNDEGNLLQCLLAILPGSKKQHILQSR